MPSTLRVENNLARLVASADLTLRGTYDRPVLFGHADIERGEVTFEGRRYRVTRGTIDFTNPTRIEPFFDVEAETHVRVPGQTYRVTVGLAGTSEQLQPTLELRSAAADGRRAGAAVQRRRARDPDAGARAARAAESEPGADRHPDDARDAGARRRRSRPRSGKVVEQTFGVDTFQLTPSFIDPYSQQTSRAQPDGAADDRQAHLGRVYLTFSRSLSTSINDQIVLLEIRRERSAVVDSVAQRGSQTYALEFRVRHIF